MRLINFLTSYPGRLWLGIGEPPTWYPVPGALSHIPPDHLERHVLVTRHPSLPQGHLWIEKLMTSYAWHTTPPPGPPGPPESPSLTVRWRAWRRGGRRRVPR